MTEITKYYVIPTHYEALLSMQQQAWLQSSDKAYMITTGHYKITDVHVIGVDVPTTIKRQDKGTIMQTMFFIDEESKTKKADLLWFVLEAKPSDMHDGLPDDILTFNTNIDYLEYANENT